MLFEIMKHIRNFFPTDNFEEGNFTIEDGTISLPFVLDGQYILIEGSNFNDGVYEYPMEDLDDESFSGVITVLAPPKAFLNLADDIQKYITANCKAESLGIQSESFGGYSYTRETKDGHIATWQDIYKQRLNVWRKV